MGIQKTCSTDCYNNIKSLLCSFILKGPGGAEGEEWLLRGDWGRETTRKPAIWKPCGPCAAAAATGKPHKTVPVWKTSQFLYLSPSFLPIYRLLFSFPLPTLTGSLSASSSFLPSSHVPLMFPFLGQSEPSIYPIATPPQDIGQATGQVKPATSQCWLMAHFC